MAGTSLLPLVRLFEWGFSVNILRAEPLHWGTYVDGSNHGKSCTMQPNLIFRKRIAGVNYDATIANAFVWHNISKVLCWERNDVNHAQRQQKDPHAKMATAAQNATMQWGADGNSLQQRRLQI